MRYSELAIQTQRAAPSEIRTPGLAFLYRAGYVSRSAELLPLGQLAIERLRTHLALCEASPISDSLSQALPGFFSDLALPAAHSDETGEYFALLDAQQTIAEEILVCPACGYASSRELARSRRQPFSVEDPLPLEKILTPECSTIAQLALFMQIPQEKTAKALMFTRLQDGKFVFVVLRGDLQLSAAKLQACVGEVRLATPEEISASGAVPGYASPVGLRGALIVVDDLITRSPNLVAGANESGYHLKNTTCARDYQADLVADLALASPDDPCPICAALLEGRAAATVFANGELLFDKLLLALAEIHHDEKGLTLPAIAAPFDVYLLNVPGKTLGEATASAAESLYAQLSDSPALSVLFDDRNERAGVKFNDADLIGCPLRVTVGERGLQNGQVELKGRKDTETRQIALQDIVPALIHPKPKI
jgi:prolyl-tRNA synthetase